MRKVCLKLSEDKELARGLIPHNSTRIKLKRGALMEIASFIKVVRFPMSCCSDKKPAAPLGVRHQVLARAIIKVLDNQY